MSSAASPPLWPLVMAALRSEIPVQVVGRGATIQKVTFGQAALALEELREQIATLQSRLEEAERVVGVVRRLKRWREANGRCDPLTENEVIDKIIATLDTTKESDSEMVQRLSESEEWKRLKPDTKEADSE